MNTYKGKVELFDGFGRVHFPVEVQATELRVAEKRARAQAERIYHKNRPGKRRRIEAVAIHLALVEEGMELKPEKPSGVPIGKGGGGTRDEAIKMLDTLAALSGAAGAYECYMATVVNKFGMPVEELEKRLKDKRKGKADIMGD